MIRKLFSEAHVLWQTCNEENLDLPCEALALSVDTDGTISIHQEGDTIVMNKETIPELCKLLKKLAQ